jgi:hypothetical protein
LPWAQISEAPGDLRLRKTEDFDEKADAHLVVTNQVNKPEPVAVGNGNEEGFEVKFSPGFAHDLEIISQLKYICALTDMYFTVRLLSRSTGERGRRSIEINQDNAGTIRTLKAHISLNVRSLGESVEFYKKMLGIEPRKVRAGYAKFEAQNPPLNLALNEDSSSGRGALSPLGIQVESTDDVLAPRARWSGEGLQMNRNSGVVDEYCSTKRCRGRRDGAAVGHGNRLRHHGRTTGRR